MNNSKSAGHLVCLHVWLFQLTISCKRFSLEYVTHLVAETKTAVMDKNKYISKVGCCVLVNMIIVLNG